MSAENIIRMAKLWDEEAIARIAVNWLESPQGAPLLRLKPSQFAALTHSVRPARSPDEFLQELNHFLQGQVRRQKRRSVWHHLLDTLPGIVKQSASDAHGGGHERNDSFDTCCLLLKRAGRQQTTEILTEERNLGAMRGFIQALARRYRARKLFGAMS